MGRADAEEVMMFVFLNLGGHFSKMDIYKCPFCKTWGRNIKNSLISSLRA
jgi:hypothetical protein